MLYLTETEVRELLTMPLALEAVREAFRSWGLDEAECTVRERCQTDQAMLHTMSAALKRSGYLGFKAYLTGRHGAHFHVVLYRQDTPQPLAWIEADYLGQVRTGAVSGVATELLARADASEVGIFGSGKQARTQLWAVCCVRGVRCVHVYSPNSEHRQRFAEEMSRFLNVEVRPVNRPDLAAADKDIIITATTSREPILRGDWVSEGAHLNVIGSNFLSKAEIDVATLRRADVIVVDSKDQARREAGDLHAAMDEGSLHWSEVYELAQVVVGRYPGRRKQEEITLFKSVGIALADVAVAARVYELARQQGIGREVPP
ncbi:Delta(1)-pyrroline-2-carboxylate reductase [bacterium HR36]|uniref:Ornithine cyclodeaminase n=1 Tax=uncultured Planctomycetota bacterium TaxID=120965 RepID=H5SCV0_9BACT|nr:ornithine cyclodeaminase [uncultured Planctomycetota bacterium]BAL57164.1 ornithine cyclodeaminase [uncultured Planctomycetota bacterium]GBD35690.1 Delta(1)-pyrroline-2-carboxylate reductase [bacterium HR36]